MELEEKLKVSDGMGAWIDDFKKSDAPQFKGKNEKEKRDMAIAAYLSAKRGDKNEKWIPYYDYKTKTRKMKQVPSAPWEKESVDEGYVSHAQRKAVWATRADGGKGHPDKPKKEGLWDNIHAKRRRGEKMRKKGDKGAPTDAAIKSAQEKVDFTLPNVKPVKNKVDSKTMKKVKDFYKKPMGKVDEAVPYRKGTHDSGDDAGNAPGQTVYNYKTKKVEFQPYKKAKKEGVDEVKMVPGFVRPDGTRTSKPTKAELGKTPEYHAMKKNMKSEGEVPFKGSYTKTDKPMTFKQMRKTVKKLAKKGMSGMKSEALQPGHHKVEIDHMGGKDSVAKKHGVTITKAKGSNPYAHHATGPKAGLQKYLKHHYDGDHGEAKANHPDVYK